MFVDDYDFGPMTDEPCVALFAETDSVPEPASEAVTCSVPVSACEEADNEPAAEPEPAAMTSDGKPDQGEAPTSEPSPAPKTASRPRGNDEVVKAVRFTSWGKVAQARNALGSHRQAVVWVNSVMPWFRGYYEAVCGVPLTDIRLLNIVSTLKCRYQSWPECDRVRTYKHKAKLPAFLDRTFISEAELREAIGLLPKQPEQPLTVSVSGRREAAATEVGPCSVPALEPHPTADAKPEQPSTGSWEYIVAEGDESEPETSTGSPAEAA